MISNKKSDNKEIKLFGNLLIYHDFMRNYYIFLINILMVKIYIFIEWNYSVKIGHTKN